jgi:glycosyltransferase involved in cell wall biosynthesis
MTVYNEERYVTSAVNSILAQDGVDLELIVVDDGSTDGSLAVLTAVQDPRIRLVAQSHAGIVAALNTGVALARGEYIARMDADDIALPGRLARQAAFLRAHSEVGLVGTACTRVDPAGRPLGDYRPPCDDYTLRRALVRDNPFVHGTVMFRREAIEQAGGYRRDSRWEDYDLWIRIARWWRVANLPEVLLVRRERTDSLSRRVRRSAAYRHRLALQLRAARQLGVISPALVYIPRSAAQFLLHRARELLTGS